MLDYVLRKDRPQDELTLNDESPPGATAGNALRELPGYEAQAAQLSTVQRKADGLGASGPASFAAGGGERLPPALETKMGAAFGTDFSAVRMHPDSGAATQLSARAFTSGRDVHFAPGQYAPRTTSGQELIGHELAHTAQQAQGMTRPAAQAKGASTSAVCADPGLELQADRAGAAAARGRRVDGGLRGVAPRDASAIQCKTPLGDGWFRSENNRILILPGDMRSKGTGNGQVFATPALIKNANATLVSKLSRVRLSSGDACDRPTYGNLLAVTPRWVTKKEMPDAGGKHEETRKQARPYTKKGQFAGRADCNLMSQAITGSTMPYQEDTRARLSTGESIPGYTDREKARSKKGQLIGKKFAGNVLKKILPPFLRRRVRTNQLGGLRANVHFRRRLTAITRRTASARLTQWKALSVARKKELKAQLPKKQQNSKRAILARLPKFISGLVRAKTLVGLTENVHYQRVSPIIKKTNAGRFLQWRRLSTARRQELSRKHGMNEYARASVGDAFTIVNTDSRVGGQYPYHWAGVVLKDGDDTVTVEGYSINATGAVSPSRWLFEMQGGPGSGDTFFDDHDLGPDDDNGYGSAPIVLSVGRTAKRVKREGKLRDIKDKRSGKKKKKKKRASPRTLVAGATGGGTLTDVLGDGCNCAIRALMRGAGVAMINETHVDQVRTHLVTQHNVGQEDFLGLGPLEPEAFPLLHYLGQHQVAFGMPGFAGRPITVWLNAGGILRRQDVRGGGGNPINLYLSDDHYQAIV